MVGPRQNGAPADRRDRADDRGLVGGDENGADIGLHRAPPDMRNHRLPMDIGQRLAWQPRRGHPRRDNYDRVRHGFKAKLCASAAGSKRTKGRVYTCCQVPRKAGNQNLVRAACRPRLATEFLIWGCAAHGNDKFQ